MPVDRMTPPRSVKLFWACIILIAALGAAYLQYLGPVEPTPHLAARGDALAIPAPSPMLLAASPVNPAWKLPHPGPYGVTPMRYYAARAIAPSGAPEIALMVAGLGEALAPSMAAVNDLPPAVSLALSPYGAHDAAIEAAARKAGHETILGLPMEVNGEPDITEGDQSLRAGAATSANLKRLDWALSRIQGYAGVTDAIGMAVPETFLGHPHAAHWLATQLAASGLFLIVATPGAPVPNGVAGQAATVTINPDDGTASITTALDRLAQTATTRGHAIGVITDPDRQGIATIAAWLHGKAAQHLALVPVSAIADPATSAAP